MRGKVTLAIMIAITVALMVVLAVATNAPATTPDAAVASYDQYGPPLPPPPEVGPNCEVTITSGPETLAPGATYNLTWNTTETIVRIVYWGGEIWTGNKSQSLTVPMTPGPHTISIYANDGCPPATVTITVEEPTCDVEITSVSVTPSSGPVGTPFTVTGTYSGTPTAGSFGWVAPNDTVEGLGELTLDNGTFSGTSSVPSDGLGVAVVISGSDCMYIELAEFDVTTPTPTVVTTDDGKTVAVPTGNGNATSPPPAGSMPYTGWEIIPFGFLGSGFLGSGGYLIRRSRRRAKH